MRNSHSPCAQPSPMNLPGKLRQLRAVPEPGGLRLRAAQRAFAASRYRALYRAWQRDGDRVLHATTSPTLADSVARHSGRLECDVPATGTASHSPGWQRLMWREGERVGERVPKRTVPPPEGH